MITLEKYTAGHYQNSGLGYKYFVPSTIAGQWQWTDQELNRLLEKAAIALGELNSYSRFVPNIELFIQLHVTKEAVISSRIEGTQTQMGDAFLNETEIAPEKKNDWHEVNNYIAALKEAVKNIESLPISSRLLKQTHKILLESVRGKEKLPGEFRRSQNWIGGISLADATFIPPHNDLVNDLMGDLENFIHSDISTADLIKIAIIHYQFETIHPFLDGNGRIGRLLITLLLVEKKILSKPLLYLSSFFDKDRRLYYDNLSVVREKNNMLQWIKYFLAGIYETAQQATNTLTSILDLKSETEQILHRDFRRRMNSATTLLNYLFQKPIVYVKEVKEVTNLSHKAANDLVNDFLDANILHEITGYNRNRIFMFHKYLDLFNA